MRAADESLPVANDYASKGTRKGRMSKQRRRTAMTRWAAVAPALCLMFPTVAQADAVANAGVDTAVPRSEEQLRVVEEQVLGAAHSAEHAEQRSTERAARFDSDAGSEVVASAMLSGAAVSDVGQWSSVSPLRRSGEPSKSVPAINAAVLPTGKVLWFGYRLDDGVRYKTESFAVLFDPVTKQIEDVPPPNDPKTGKPVALYCGGMSLLPDGRLLVTGGYLDYHETSTGAAAPNAYSGLNQVWTFDPVTKEWQRHEDMDDGRWYPTQMLMPDGRTMIMQGLDSTGEEYNRQVEVFDPTKPLGQEIDSLDRELTTTEDGDYYPHMFWLPSGRGLVAGPDRLQSYFVAKPSPLTLRTTDFANPMLRRTWGAGLLMPLDHDSTTGTVWQLGGSDGPQRDKPNTATVEAFDERNPSAWTPAPSQQVARSHQNAVLLPDGGIAAIGGGHGNRGTNWDSAEEHKQMELYDPNSRTWKLGPAQAEARAYHSTAMLLPDGSVLSAGDDRLPEHALDSYEIYKPPYFFKGERPVISSAPASSAWGRTVWVGTRNSDIDRAVLVAPSATTHAVDMSQRVINLPARKRADGAGYDVDMPVNANIALPGHHMLFLIDSQGRPSHASWIDIRADAPQQSPPPGGGPADPQPTPTPQPTVTPQPTPTPTPVVTPQPTPTPTPVVTPQPTSPPLATSPPQPTSPPRPTVTPQPTATPRPTPADTRDPRVSARLRTPSVASVRRYDRLRLRVGLDEGGSVRFSSVLTRERSSRSDERVTLARWSRSLRFSSAGGRDARLVLTDRASRRLRGSTNARLTLRFTATDASGNRRTSTVRIRLRR